MPFSKQISALSTLSNALVASAAFFFTYSILKRTNAILFSNDASSATFGYTPDLFVSFGYSAEEVSKAVGTISATGTLVLIVNALLSLMYVSIL
jgi:hypothetical protein